MHEPVSGTDRLYLLSNQFRSYLGGTRVKQIELDGEQWSYLEAGDAEQSDTIIFLHGLSMSKQHWRSLFPILSQQFHLIAPDIVGMNISLPSQDHHYGFDALSGWLTKLIEELDLDNIHLVGHSLGATLALNTALLQPKRIKSLTMVSLSDFNFSTANDSIAAIRGFQHFVATMDFPLYQQYVNSLFYNEPLGLKPMIRRTWQDIENHKDQLIRMLSELEKELTEIQSQARHLECPVMVMTGMQDNVGEQIRLFTRRMIPNAEWVNVNFCGHVPFLEQPKRFSQLLQKFLSEHASPASPETLMSHPVVAEGPVDSD